MSWLQGVVLALVQGLTEFLPISSSAHLVLTSQWLGWEDQGLTFDMAVHGGSLVAICIVVRSEIGSMLRGLATLRPAAADRRLALQVLVATLPVAVVGLLGADWVEANLRQTWVIAVTSILFGLLLGWADRRAGTGSHDLGALAWSTVVMVGLAQALAVVPGTSRSGVTMTAALALGVARPAAARFSFLLAVPVMSLVAAKSAVDIASAPQGAPPPAIVGVSFLLAAAAAYGAARWLLSWLEGRGMGLFVVYRVILGVGILIAYML